MEKGYCPTRCCLLRMELDSLLPSADVVALALPNSEASRHLMNEARLRSMKRGAILLNVGRGSAVDTDPLVKVLNEGLIMAGIDVTDPEPLPKEHPLWHCPGIIITPHISGYYHLRHTQDTILASYLNDMSKYNNLNEIKKTRLAYDNITVQLSKKNTRFQYKLIKKGGRASEFENAIEWLCLSGIVSQVYKVEQVKKPLENYRDIDAFKIYVSDLGLLCAKKDLAANDILYMVEEIDDFKGGMAENYVNVQLTINGYHTYYWESQRGAEIDFVIQRDGQLIPIEVKSADNTKAKSLKVYMDTYKPAYAIKLSAKNFGFEDNKKIVPLYAAFCI